MRKTNCCCAAGAHAGLGSQDRASDLVDDFCSSCWSRPERGNTHSILASKFGQARRNYNGQCATPIRPASQALEPIPLFEGRVPSDLKDGGLSFAERIEVRKREVLKTADALDSKTDPKATTRQLMLMQSNVRQAIEFVRKPYRAGAFAILEFRKRPLLFWRLRTFSVGGSLPSRFEHADLIQEGSELATGK